MIDGLSRLLSLYRAPAPGKVNSHYRLEVNRSINVTRQSPKWGSLGPAPEKPPSFRKSPRGGRTLRQQRPRNRAALSRSPKNSTGTVMSTP
jgi:hypothetical protein